MESLADADGPVEISAGETGASMEVSMDLLAEVASAAGAGDGMVLLSTSGLSKDAASSLATDDVRAVPGARRLASALRSQPISINFRSADGTKIDVQNLTTPMKMQLKVEDPDATCAYWDSFTAQWSSEGVQTLSSEDGFIQCSTTHLSIFAGVIEVALRNVLLALECSTLGALVQAEAFAKLIEPEWFGRSATVVTILMVVVFGFLLVLAARADRYFYDVLPWSEREHLLMRVPIEEEKPKDVDSTWGAGPQVAQGPQGPRETEVQLVEIDQETELDEPGATVEQQEKKEGTEPEAVEAVESVESVEAVEAGDKKGDEGEERGSEEGEAKKEDETKENAAGGDLEIPSIFRTVRGAAEGLLDTVSQALGGDSMLDSLKDGADQVTARVLQSGDIGASKELSGTAEDADAERGSRRSATSVHTEGNPEDAPDGQGPGSRRQWTSVETVDVQSATSENSAVNRRAPLERAGTSVSEAGAEELQRRSKRRSSVVEMIGAAVGAARNSTFLFKARAMRGHVEESGAGAANEFLSGNVVTRMRLLFPAAHTWAKLAQFSIAVSYSIRVALLSMKVLSAGALNALFYSSSSPAPGSDPECSPKSGSFEYWVQKFTVGTVSASVGDLVILALFLMVRMTIKEKPEWTEEEKRARRKKWRRRIIFFWCFAAIYDNICLIYICLFIANAREEDAMQWLEATGMSLLQDFLVKPLVLAAILTIVSSLVLYFRPGVRKAIEEEWLRGQAVASADPKDPKDPKNPKNPKDLQDSFSSDSDEEEKAEERVPVRHSLREAEFAGVLPGVPH
eukprot:s657_g17.t1